MKTAVQHSVCRPARQLRQLRGTILTAIPISCLVTSLMAAGWLQIKTAETERWVQHTQTILVEANQLLASLLNAETSVRSYDITLRPEVLEPYQQAIATIPYLFRRLNQRVSENSQQTQQLQEVEQAATKVLQLLQLNLDTVDNRDLTERTIADLTQALLQSKVAMDQARWELQSFVAEEEQLLAERRQRLQRQRQITWVMLIVMAAVGVTGSVLAMILFDRLNQDLDTKDRFFDLSMDWLAIANADGHFKLTNGAVATLLGYSIEEILQRSWTELLHPDDQAETQHYLEKFSDQARTAKFENRYRHRDGSYRWLSWSMVSVPEEKRFYGVARDITDRKQTEEALRREQEFTKVLVEGFSDAVVACDAQGSLTLFNRLAQEWHGTDLRTLPQEQWADFYNLFRGDGTTPLPMAEVPLIRAFQGEQVRGAEMAIVTPNQPIRYVVANGDPLFDEVGHQLGAVAVMHDITERRQFEEALERERQQLRQIISSAPVAMAMFDLDMRYIAYSNRWRIDYGLLDQDLIGRSHDEIFPNLTDRWRSIYRQALQGKTIESPEDIFEMADGSKYYLRWAICPWRNPDDSIGGIVMATDRIDALVEAREAALEHSRLKSQFLANMSHEIRTPMNGVLGMAGLLLKTELSAKQHDFVQAIRTSADHLLAIINDILDVSKLEAGEMQLDRLDFALNDCLEDVINLLSTQAAEKHLDLALLIDQEVPKQLKGDPGRLRQVLLNLMGNAIKFTPSGEVVLRVHVQQQTTNAIYLRFEVTDTGIGISPEGQKKLFHAFSQVDASLTRQYEGTGLGLAICRQIVQLMGGEIGVESVVNQGSTFWFTAQFEQGVAHNSSVPRHLSDLKLLIADANATIRQSIRYLAQSWGMQSQEVADAAAVAQMLQQAADQAQPYDVVLIDCQLPQLELLAFMSWVQAQPELVETKFIVMASLQQRDRAEQYIGSGVSSCLVKPIRPSQLFDHLLTAVANRWVKPLTAPSTPVAGVANSGMAIASNLQILLVEDHPINQQVILNQLEDLGYRARVVNNGQEALDQIAQQAFDLILMDCQMPVLDGYETTRQLRLQTNTTQQPIIIALTAHALPSDREKCLAAGMNDYISKPVDQDELERVLKRWVETIRQTDQPETRMSTHGDRTPAPDAAPERLPKDQDAASDSDWLDVQRLDRIARGKPNFKQKLLTEFLNLARQDLQVLRQAIDAGNFEQIIQLAHRLKGASANVGMTQLTKIARQLEANAQQQSVEEGHVLLDVVEMQLHRLTDLLQTEFSSF